MKKILYMLQLSFIDKDGNFLINNDSNFSVFYNIVKSFDKYYKSDYMFYVLLPKNVVTEFKNLSNITPIYNADIYTKKVFSSRYNWPAETLAKYVDHIKPDIIWENNPTLINNWKTLLLELGMINSVKIVGYNHWIDSEKFPKIDRRVPYSIRQAEGVLLSDLFLCNSNEARNQIIEAICEIYKPDFIEKYNADINTLPPYIDDEFIDVMYNVNIGRKPGNNTIRIAYNHRLSSLPYYKEPYERFIKALNYISEKVQDTKIIVYFTDVSGKIKERSEIEFQDTENITISLVKGLSKESYLQLLVFCDICVGAFLEKYGGAWSISLADGILTKCATIVPNHTGYKEMVDAYYPLLINDDQNLGEVLLDIINNPDIRLQSIDLAYNFYKAKYSMKALAEKLHKYLKIL